MSLARLGAKHGAYAVSQSIDAMASYRLEYVVALAIAWRRRDRPVSRDDQVWLASRAFLDHELARELYDLAVENGIYDAGQALADEIASRYPEVS